MAGTVYDGLGFLFWVLALFFPMYWWGACFIWQAISIAKYGALNEGVYLVPMKKAEAPSFTPPKKAA